MKEYVSEKRVRRNGMEWARRECMDRERWRFVCRGHPLGGCFRRERSVGAIDWLMVYSFKLCYKCFIEVFFVV